jgi:hypothetical protein
VTDVLVLVVIAAAVGVLGVGAGILVARPLERAMAREDESDETEAATPDVDATAPDHFDAADGEPDDPGPRNGEAGRGVGRTARETSE